MDASHLENVLDNNGCVRLYTDDGAAFRLHKHDVSFQSGHVVFECGDESYTIPEDAFVRYEIPKSDRIE